MPRRKANTEDESLEEVIVDESVNISPSSILDSYLAKSQNAIDWLSLIDLKYIVPNRDKFIKRNQPVPASTDNLLDTEKLILLAGFKQVAQIRGYSKVDYTPLYVDHEMVSVKCTITWLPSEETKVAVEFSALADASVNNTHNFAKNFLATIAENRSFVRAVRNFLNIPILGQDEMGPSESSENENSSKDEKKSESIDLYSIIENKMKSKEISFDKFKAKMISSGFPIEPAESYQDISPNSCLKILDFLNKKK